MVVVGPTPPVRDVSFIVLCTIHQQQQQHQEEHQHQEEQRNQQDLKREMIDFKVKLRNLSQRQPPRSCRKWLATVAETRTVSFQEWGRRIQDSRSLSGSNQQRSLPWHSINSMPCAGTEPKTQCLLHSVIFRKLILASTAVGGPKCIFGFFGLLVLSVVWITSNTSKFVHSRNVFQGFYVKVGQT